MKSLFKRFAAFTLCVVMALTLVGDLGGALPIFAASASPGPEPNIYLTRAMALDIIHRSANNDLHTYHTVINKDNSSSFSNEYISFDVDSGIVTVNAIDAYGVFVGFAVLAGNDIVSFATEDGKEVLKIDYGSVDSDKSLVHEVKINVFYMEEPQHGADFGAGSGAGNENDVCYIALDKNGDVLERSGSTSASAIEDRFYIVDPAWVTTTTYGELSLNVEDFTNKYDLVDGNNDGLVDVDEDGESDATGVAKLYNTSAGLHTDKTVYATEARGDSIDGSRKFDVTLESWYGGNATADIGLILDASGSMAFSSSNMIPMRLGQGSNMDQLYKAFTWLNHDNVDVTYSYDKELEERARAKYGDFTLSYNDKTKEYTLTTVDNVETENKDYYYYTSDGSSDTGATYTFKANEYLPPEIVDILLKQTDTDNSMLGYSGYSYYVYDRRASHSEFNPLGYWGGKSKQTEPYTETTDPPATEKLIGHYTFDDTLKNDKSSSGEAKLINNITKGATFDKDTTPSVKTEPTFTSGGNDLQLDETAEKGALLADVQTTESFTISMRVKANPLSNGDKATVNTTPLLYVGNGTNYISVYRSGNNSDPRRLKVDVNNNVAVLNIENLFQTKDKNGGVGDNWVNISLTYDNSTKQANVYLSVKAKENGTNDESTSFDIDLSDYTLNFSNADIIIGGDVVNKPHTNRYTNTQMTTFCVFNKVLTASNIATLNGNKGKDISTYATVNGIGGLSAFYDFGDAGSDNKLANCASSSSGSLKFIKQAENGAFSKEEIQGKTELKPSYEGNALNLTQTVKNGGILLDAVPTDQNDFTISFKVTNSNQKGEKPEHEAELVYMGPANTTEGYYNIFRSQNVTEDKSGDPNHIRFSKDSNYTGTKASGSHAFNEGDWTTVTFTVKNGSITAYVNGAKSTGGVESDATLGQLTAQDFAIILGGLKDNYDGKDILIDELFVYDKALDSDEVSQLYKSLQEPKVIAAAANVALDDSGNPIAYIDAALVVDESEKEKMRGWYYVNSTSDWVNNYDNPKVGTAKELKGVPNNEVIPNDISINNLPQDIKEMFESYSSDPKDPYYRSDGNGGFIYTSNTDFTASSFSGTNKYYYGPEENDGKADQYYITKIESYDTDESSLGEHEGKAAIKLPVDVKERSGNGKLSPVIFFVDDAGYLRCFYSNSNSKTESKNSSGPRSSASYVYFKWDCNDVKTDSLQAALGTFNADLEEISPSSRVSAVRFSSSEIEDKDLDKLVMLDWTKDPAAATKMLSLEYGEGESTGFDNSVPSLENENNSQSSIKQYNYGLTGGTSTYQGLKAFNDILLPRMDRDELNGLDRDEGKGKYVIIFTDGKDTNVEDLTSTDEDEKKAAQAKVDGSKEIAQTLKSDGFTIFYVLLKSGSFTVIDDAEKEFIASIAGNTDTSDRDYETLKNGGDDKKRYIFEATGGNDLTNIFRNDILGEISKTLNDYTVKDYIDPRFDLIGYTKDEKDHHVETVFHLNDGGKVEYIDAKDGETIKTVSSTSSLPIELSSNNGNSEIANLYYDDGYYLTWARQDIPFCTVGDSELTVWRSEFKIVAKEDFIGGNAILTNGNKEKQNYVYDPDDGAASSGKDKADADISSGGYVSKGFPRTAANVRRLPLEPTVSNSDIYLGETISPEDIITALIKQNLADEKNSSPYFEYLLRTEDNKTKLAKLFEGLEDDGKETLTLPYSYVTKENDADSYAGDNAHQKDYVGTITYTLKDETENLDSGETIDDSSVITLYTKERKYTLTVDFEPFKVESKSSVVDGIETDRNTANGTLVTDGNYEWDNSFKPAAGAVQSGFSKEIENTHTVDMVRGQIVLRAALSDADYDYICKYYPDAEIYSADLVRTYGGKDTTVGTFTVKTPAVAATALTGEKYLYAEFKPASGTGLKDLLPIGDYSFANAQPNADLPLVFESLDSIKLVEDLTDDALAKFNDYVYIDSSGKMQKASKGDTDHRASYTYAAGLFNDPAGGFNSSSYYGPIKLGTASADAGRLDDLIGLAEIRGTLKTGTLTITKTVVDNSSDFAPDADQTFTFNVKFFNGADELTADDFDNITVSIGGAPAMPFNGTVTLKAGESAEISGIPVGVTYTVEEQPVDSFTTEYEFADETKTISDSDGDTVKVTNTYEPSVSATLSVEKTITGEYLPNRETSFKFKLAPVDENGDPITDGSTPMSESDTITINFEATPDATTSKTNSDSWNLTFTKVGTYYYTVTETVPSDTEGFIYDEKAVHTVKFEVTANTAENKLNVAATVDGVPAVSDAKVSYNNNYKPDEIEVYFDGTKKLTGRDWAATDKFEFTIEGDDVPLPTPTTVSVNSANHGFTFGPITFTKPGKYTYTIKETDGTDDKIAYDGTVYTVVVTVTDTDGKLEYSVSVDGTSIDSSDIIGGHVEGFDFENIYTPAAATIDVSGTKSFTLANGEAPEADEIFTFTFNVIETDSTWTEIISSDSKTVTFSGSDLSGTPSQKPIVDLLKKTYELKDIPEIQDGGSVKYYYKITEKNDGTAHISYDNAEYHITVTVSYSKESGILSASYDVTDAAGKDADIAFSNTYIPDAVPATANITVTKEVDGDELPSDANFTFTFTVTETDENHEPLAGAAPIPPITITNEGSTLFTREFTASDIGTHYYTIAEDLNDPRFECDEPVKYVTVTVGYDPAANTVTAEPSVSEVKFTNTYTAPKPHITIAKSQTVVNGLTGTPLTVKAGDIVEYTLTVSNDGDVDAPAVKVVDTVPTGLDIIEESVVGGTLDGQKITWTLTVGAHNSATVSFRVTVPPVTARTTWRNIAYADGTPSETVVLIEEKPKVGNIEIRKTLTGNDFDTNDRFSFTIEVYGDDGITPILAETFELGQGESKKYDNLPDGAKFTVTETDTLGYTPSVNGVSGNYYEGVVRNGTTVVVRFENERSKPVVQTGSLTVRKTVAGPAEAIIPETFGFTYTLGLPSDFTETEFDYTISHFDYMGVEVIDGSGKLGVSGTFSLNNGRRIKISGLPAGTTYQVDELPTVGSYIVDRYNTSGVITLDENGAVADAYAVFVNTIKTGQLTVSKTAVGNLAMSTDMFGFMVSLYHDAALSEPAQEVSGQFGGMYFDSGVAYISLADGESVTAVGLPVGLYYNVEEIDASGYESGVAGEQIGVITTGMISDTETCSAAFVNLKQKNIRTGDLTVSKIVTGEGDTSYPFPFTLELYYHDTTGSPEVLAADVNLTGKIIGGEPRDVSVTGGCAAFNLSHGESLRLEGLPEDIHYIITETDPNGHTVTISNTGAFTPTYYDPLYGIMTVDETQSNVASGDVKGGEHVSVTFYNHIEPEPEPEPASTSLTITKTFDQAGSTKDNALTFSFDVALISAVDPSGSPIADASGSFLENVTVNKGDEDGYGTVDLSFDRAGIYTYSIKERAEYIGDVPEGGELYTVTEEKLATVTVTEVNGILTATPIEPIVFENRYVAPKEPPTPSSAVITVQKLIEGDDISGESFNFDFTVTETDQSGNIIDELHIANEGTDTFITREFTEEDIGNTYYYTITEVDGSIKGMSYADAQTVTVSVTYDEAANAVVATATPNPVVFTNTYTRPDPSLAEIKLTKKVSDSSGKEYAEGSFTFEVNLTSHPEYSENGFTNGKATVTVDGGATVVLTVPFGAEYEITEINVPDGYTDSTEKLKGVADGSTVELIYNNVKTPKTGSLTLRKILVVDGRISEGGRKFRFKIELLGSDFTGDANGVSFDNGVAWVELSGGESVTMTGLPVGVDYVITEDSANGYTLLSESSSGLSGTITADSDAVAIAVNATFGSRTPFNPPPMTSEPDPDDRVEIIPSTEGGSGEGDEVPDESEPNPVTGALGSGMALLLAAALALAAKRR